MTMLRSAFADIACTCECMFVCVCVCECIDIYLFVPFCYLALTLIFAR
jgi:hypothetical protein